MKKKIFTHIQRKLNYEDLVVENTSAGRTYITTSGNRYPSITTVLGVLKDGSLDEWRNKVGHEVANRITRVAGNRGTKMHLAAEKYLQNDPAYLKGQMPHVIELFKSIQPILDSRVDNIHAQEAALFSDKFEIAGRVDCIAEFDSELSIIDFKTSTKQKEEAWISGYFIQMSFYAAAYYEQTGIPIKKIVVIMAVDSDFPQVFVQSTYPWLKELLKARHEYRKRYAF
jgi:hypothetical protein